MDAQARGRGNAGAAAGRRAHSLAVVLVVLGVVGVVLVL